MVSTSRTYLLVVILILTCISLHGQITSTFNSNAEGWTTPNDADATITYAAAGGNPGGLVAGSPFVLVLGATTIYVPFDFVAPGTYLGNRSSYYNGTLRYDIQQSTAGAPNQLAEVTIANSLGITLYYFPATPNQPAAAPAWTTFSVTLNNALGYWKTTNSATGSAATEAQVLNVLTDLASLQIRGLYRDANTTNRLDNVSMRPPIVITMQPTSSTICNGVTTTLTTVATGNPTLTYQWQFETSPTVWTNITNTGGYSGVTTTTLSVNTTGNFGGGNYRCRISGLAVDDAITSTATITINPLPTAPTTTGSSSCTAASLTLTAAGGAAGQYRWYTVPTGGTAIAGQTNSNYTTPLLSATTTYYVAINNGTCESTRTPVVANIAEPGCGNTPPVIQSVPITTQINGKIILNLVALISDSDNNIDFSTLVIVTPPSSGATASIDNSFNLIIDYTGISFSGTENITVQVCDIFSACTDQVFAIEVIGDIEIFTGLSPNKDGKNDIFLIRYIDLIPETQKNKVTIFNRWGSKVFEVSNYNNTTNVFRGLNNEGTELPTGTYFFKIEFTTGRQAETGYLALKR